MTRWASFPRATAYLYAGLLPLGLLLFARRSRRLRGASVLCLVLLITMLPLTGCGSTGSPAANASQGLVTPLGSYTVTVTFAGTTTHSTSFTFVVIANNTGF